MFKLAKRFINYPQNNYHLMRAPKSVEFIKNRFKKIIFVDIDNTICECSGTEPEDPDYNLCVPYPERIQKINRLYEEGNYILYWTARGCYSGDDYTDFTNKQLNEWGCKYNELKVKKPFYDLFIDDKNINSEDFFKC